MRTVAFLLALIVAAPAVADEPGYLLLQNHDAVASRSGAQAAELFVYREDGAIVHSGSGGGQYAAGEYVEVEPGWYFVEVGRFRAPINAVKVFVETGHVTVVPSGWISVRTPAIDEQPTHGCAQWNAELNAFAGTGDDATLINTNRGSGVQQWGALQLLAGPANVHFNEVPVDIEVVADEVNELPTGYQDPVYGERPLLATAPNGDPSGLRLPLCSDGSLQVPAGVYWTSGAVAIDVYPYERREWNEATVVPEREPASDSLRTSRLQYPRFEGEGAEPAQLTDDERARFGSAESGGGIRLMGFD